MLVKSILTVVFLFSAYANACMKNSANVVGKGVGAKVNEAGVCEMLVEITRVTSRHPQCPLRVRVGQEIRVRTGLEAEKCPKSEVTLRGKLSSGGGGYSFQGTIRNK